MKRTIIVLKYKVQNQDEVYNYCFKIQLKKSITAFFTFYI